MAAARERERRLPLFGGAVRVHHGPPQEDGTGDAAAGDVERLLRSMQSALSRFDPASELSRANRDPRVAVPVGPLLSRAIAVALEAAAASGGLVDPTLLGELEAAGYARSRADAVPSAPSDLAVALAVAPPRRAARPNPLSHWRSVVVDEATGFLRRPAGVRFDLGGTAKGLAADLAAERLTDLASFAVDVGGDIRVGGVSVGPRLVTVPDPIGGGVAHELHLIRGAVATSGIARHNWRRNSGFAHHLIDPATGEPAWTGVVQATAIAPTAVRAETLAKAALLSGPKAGADLLAAAHGGVLILDDGSVLALEAGS